MSSRSILHNFKSKQEGLPVSRGQNYVDNANNKGANSSNKGVEEAAGGGIRRRLSSLKIRLQGPVSGSMGGGYLVGRSKSMSSVGEYAGNSIRKWWEWGWDWILSRKPIFAQDLEMNQQETVALGAHNQGSWRHVFYKLKCELGKLVGGGSTHNSGLPKTTLDTPPPPPSAYSYELSI